MLSNRTRAGVFLATALASLLTSPANATRDASGVGEWISVGTVATLNIGSTGNFYLTGADHGMCAAVAEQTNSVQRCKRMRDK